MSFSTRKKNSVDITEAPSWAGAINDGKLRIPIRGVSVMNPELQRVLKHELTHSFMRSLAGGRCPTWLNEGIAELMEPRSSSAFAQPLAALFQQRKEIPFSVLEHPFIRFSDVQAQVAYAESLSGVEYLRDRYGMAEVVRMLRNIAAGDGAGDCAAAEHRDGLRGVSAENRRVSAQGERELTHESVVRS